MNPQFAISPDGKKIAYDLNGAGPAIVLLHGGGGNRLEWRDAGYVDRLQDDFTVITLDLRGHGESALPTNPTDYTIDKMQQDILSVADACGVELFNLWAMSYGGKVGRYLATTSDRVTRVVLMSAQLGPGTPGKMRQEVMDFCTHWPPILEAQRDGTLDHALLSQHDKEFMHTFNVPVMLAWGRAMLDWPAVEPADFHCPTLWLIGSEDQPVIDNFKEYETSLAESRIQAQILEGLNHEQVFDEIDRVLPILLAFTRSC
jgi:pimeloyl-ACP methyl ester carboxylesterase